jgi:hypothetical protein
MDVTLESACGGVPDAPRVKITTKKLMKGHLNKVNSVHYSGDNRHCVTGSLDGKLIIWDTYTGNKMQIIPLRSAWVMSVAYAPSGNFVGTRIAPSNAPHNLNAHFSVRRDGQHVHHLRPEQPRLFGGGQDGPRARRLRRLSQLLPLPRRQEHHHRLGRHENVTVCKPERLPLFLFSVASGTWRRGEKPPISSPTTATSSPLVCPLTGTASSPGASTRLVACGTSARRSRDRRSSDTNPTSIQFA